MNALYAQVWVDSIAVDLHVLECRIARDGACDPSLINTMSHLAVVITRLAKTLDGREVQPLLAALSGAGAMLAYQIDANMSYAYTIYTMRSILTDICGRLDLDCLVY